MIKKSIPNIDHSEAMLRMLQQKFIKAGRPVDDPPGFKFAKSAVLSAVSSLRKFSRSLTRHKKNSQNINF